ncbi:LPS-assembly lipoprotein LptE [hydrothermal vent metagenome]|uniref:LPS-assembly lipoprotein LptE n=1 Tax=hydrothermal vent metagenome TaxID=652676 RepID=A0A3B0YJX4_9ZZZZ
MIASKRLLPSTAITLAVLLAALLSACGFQLRGSIALPPALNVTLLEVKDPWQGIAAALREELESSGARVTARASDATAVLTLTDERSKRRVLSVGSRGKASEYELFEGVTFSLRDSEGQELLKPQKLSLTRDLVFDQTRLLGKESEREELQEQMHRSLARQIITRIRTRLQAHEPATP